MKGYRGRAAGDGPIARREQSRRVFIARNGFLISKNRRHNSAHGNQNITAYFVSFMLSTIIQQKFTITNDSNAQRYDSGIKIR